MIKKILSIKKDFTTKINLKNHMKKIYIMQFMIGKNYVTEKNFTMINVKQFLVICVQGM